MQRKSLSETSPAVKI